LESPCPSGYVLEVYERPYNAQEPVICVDEKPITLQADLRPASPAVPGREARRDNEYEPRNRQCLLCCRTEGGPLFHVCERRTARASSLLRLHSHHRVDGVSMFKTFKFCEKKSLQFR
jgi:hypothetical protein